ncbi:unnamed protein product [Arabis nemorensis]|uniref:Uncharacterized protein n=1 Tax=Arabis nemorensis TaxID=586526 RepID=A0A565B6H6_9BRAS|nr:unnamed protein product [Arabis nemorensis]
MLLRLKLIWFDGIWVFQEEKLPYSLYVSDEKLVVSIGTYMEQRQVYVEKILTRVYRQQAVFRTRPFNVFLLPLLVMRLSFCVFNFVRMVQNLATHSLTSKWNDDSSIHNTTL